MRRTLHPATFLIPILAIAFGPAAGHAQTAAGNAAMVVWVDPLPGHGAAFEEGVRRHTSAMQEAGDTRTWVMFEVIAGERTGQYVVGTFNHAWADFDQPPPVDRATGERSMTENISPHVEGVEIQYAVRDPELSMWSPDDPIAPMYQVIEWTIKPGHMPAFETFLAKVRAAFEGMGEGGSYSIFRPVIGGTGSRLSLSIPRQGFAEFAEDDPDWLENMMREAYGTAETRMLMEGADAALASERSHMLVLRPDLSMNLPEN